MPTAAAVEADALIVTMTRAPMVNPRPARRFARELGAQHLKLDTPCGHLGTGCRADTVQTTVRQFLRSEPSSDVSRPRPERSY